MNRPTPTAFTGPSPALRPEQQLSRVVVVPHAVLPRSVPMLTVQEDYDCNLNAAASALVGRFDGICLRRPPAVRAGRPPQLWELGPGECNSIRSHSGPKEKASTLRFRAADAPPPGAYILLPVAGASTRFSLLPC